MYLIGDAFEIKTGAKHVEADIDVVLGQGFNSPRLQLKKTARESVRFLSFSETV